MSTDDIRIKVMVDEILNGANIEAEKLINEAKKQTKEILEKGKEVANKEKLAMIELQTKNVSEKEKQQIASINLQARREILQKKEEEIRKTFELAEAELKEFHKKTAYIKVLESLIIEAGIALNGGNLIIKMKKEDKNKIKELNAITKEIIKKSGNKCILKIADESINAIGGVIVQIEDGSIKIDNTFDARLAQKYRLIRKEAAGKLFG